MRSLQLRLQRLWDQEDDSTLIPWDQDCRIDLEWWTVTGRLQASISLAQVNPHLDFWSDASDVGWGAHLLDSIASGRWSQEEAQLSINARELLAVEYGLWHFHLLAANSTVAVFADNSTALAYLRKQGGTRSPVLNPLLRGSSAGRRRSIWSLCPSSSRARTTFWQTLCLAQTRSRGQSGL